MNTYNIDGYNRAVAIKDNRIFYVKSSIGFPKNENEIYSRRFYTQKKKGYCVSPIDGQKRYFTLFEIGKLMENGLQK